MTTADSTTGGELEPLEEERDFLLRSLADLDAEHQAGDIDERDYRTLSDDYTARAAAVLHAIDALSSPSPRPSARKGAPSAAGAAGRGAQRAPRSAASESASSASATGRRVDGTSGREPRGRLRTPAPGATRSSDAAGTGSAVDDETDVDETDVDDDIDDRSPRGAPAPREAALRSRRRWLLAAVVVAVLGFGVVAIWAVSQSSGSRLPGQTVTGNAQITGSTVAGGIDPRLVDASNLVNQGKVADALKEYDAILKDDPNQPVALAYGGWLEAQAGLAANRSDLVDSGLAQIVKSEQVAPTFTDPHFFRGFLLLRAKNDAAGAVTELRFYLGAINPGSPQVAQVQSLLQEAVQAAGPNVPPGRNAPSTTAGPPTTARP